MGDQKADVRARSFQRLREAALAIRSALSEGEEPSEPTLPPPARAPYAERIRAFAEHEQPSDTACQSVVIATVQTLNGVLHREREAARTAITLAQRERLHHMVESLEATVVSLRNLLSGPCARMAEAPTRAPLRTDDQTSWWFVLAETLQAIEDGIDRLRSTVSGQPKGAPARQLTSIVARQLRAHHHALLHEAAAYLE